MINTIIIEDELHGITNLTNLLNRYCPDIHIENTAGSIKEGLNLLSVPELQPDLVFLDINLPDGLVFQLLDQLDEINFEIIFATAYERFAVKAFDYSSIGYITKPIDPEMLIDAVLKVRLQNKATIERRLQMLKNYYTNPNPFNKICIPSHEKLHFLEVNEIVRMEGSDNLTQFFLKDGSKIWSTKTIKYFNAPFSKCNFFRIHKKHIVNLNFIKNYVKGEGGFVVMQDDTKLGVARRRKLSFMDKLKELQAAIA